MKKLVLLILFSLALVGCESRVTKDAKLSGQITTDMNGRQWLLRHHIGDTYFIYEVRNGRIILDGE